MSSESRLGQIRVVGGIVEHTTLSHTIATSYTRYSQNVLQSKEYLRNSLWLS